LNVSKNSYYLQLKYHSASFTNYSAIKCFSLLIIKLFNEIFILSQHYVTIVAEIIGDIESSNVAKQLISSGETT